MRQFESFLSRARVKRKRRQRRLTLITFYCQYENLNLFGRQLCTGFSRTRDAPEKLILPFSTKREKSFFVNPSLKQTYKVVPTEERTYKKKIIA